MKKDIPPDLRRFILAHIPSVPHLEALMLVRATAPRRWNAACLAQRLYVSTAAAAGVLADLCQSGLLLREDAGDMTSYLFPRNGQGEQIELLAALHAHRLVELTVLIHQKPERP